MSFFRETEFQTRLPAPLGGMRWIICEKRLERLSKFPEYDYIKE